MSKIKVKVVQVPGGVTEVEIESGQTVKEALELAQVDPKGYQVMIKGKQIGVSTKVSQGMKIILAEDVEGNK